MSHAAKKHRAAAHRQAPAARQPESPAGRALRRFWPLLAMLGVALVVGIAIQYIRTATVPSDSAAATTPPAVVPQVLGDASAPVLVEEYGDFQCPACGNFEKSVAPSLRQLAQSGKIRFAYYPIAILGQESVDASNASLCAADEGRFWQYHDQLFAHQAPENTGFLTKTRLLGFGDSSGVMSGQFDLCVTNSRHKDQVVKITDDASRKGVNQTPTVYVNGTRLGNPSLEQMLAAIDKAATK